jgi:DNA polymerase-3 subunit epsilon
MTRCTLDTETSGKWHKNLDFDHPDQPRIMSMGACLFDDDFREIGSAYAIVKPEWPRELLQAEALEKHGITYEQAMDEGVPWDDAWSQMEGLLVQADQVIIYNEVFDRNLLNIETLLRFGQQSYLNTRRNQIVCLMKLATRIMQMPGQYGDYKWPKLEEFYEWLYGEPLVGNHNSETDARTGGWCAFKILEQKLWNGTDLC